MFGFSTCLVHFRMKIVTNSSLTQRFSTCTHILTTLSSLSFDKKGEFSRFDDMPAKSLFQTVLKIGLQSILDTFSIKSTKRCPNYIIESLDCRSSRKLLQRDFRSTEKQRYDALRMSRRLSFSAAKWYNLMPLITFKRFGTLNIVSSDRVWRFSECADGRKSMDSQRQKESNWLESMRKYARREIWETKKVFWHGRGNDGTLLNVFDVKEAFWDAIV